MPLPPVAERFLRYVQIDTQSDPDAVATPSTEKQKDLGRLLVHELRAMGLADAHMDDCGYVFATIPHTLSAGDAARAQVKLILRDFTEAGLQRRKNQNLELSLAYTTALVRYWAEHGAASFLEAG